MAFPTSDVDTQHLDASTDSPAAARGSLLDLVQKFNSLRAFFNSFWLGLLATTSAATARTGLGATTVGSAVFTAASQSAARTAIGALSDDFEVQWTDLVGTVPNVSTFTNDPGYITTAFGYNQTIQTPTRALDTSYTNGSGKLRVCIVVGSGAVGNLVGYINTGSGFVEGPIVTIPSSASFATLTLLVPIGASYKVDQQNGASIYKWQEY